MTLASVSAGSTELARILDAYLAALESGSAPDKAELLAAHPERADQLEACLASLEFIGAVVTRRSPDGLDPIDVEALEAIRMRIGDFRLIREIGRGGMGVVYEAEQLSLSRRVALKVLPFAAALDSRQVKRFQNEASSAAGLDHPHIVSVYAVGCDRGVHFYAMQYVHGHCLAELLELLRSPHDEPDSSNDPAETVARASASTLGTLRGRDYFRRVAEIGKDAGEALQYAHEMGVIHRDIKPSNLMIDSEGTLLLTDFGLAMTQNADGLTMTGDLIGTLRYMSPEQAAGRREAIDHRTDIYSLGITLYELATRRAAFTDDDRETLLRRVIEDDPPRPRTVVPTLPRNLETILLKATSKEPADRYRSAAALAADLDRFCNDRPILARRSSWAERSGVWPGVIGLSLRSPSSCRSL